MEEFPVMAEISFSAETRLQTMRKSPRLLTIPIPFTEHLQHPSFSMQHINDAELCYVEVPVHLRGMSKWVPLLAKGAPQSYSRILQSTKIFPPLFFLSQNTKFWD